MSATLPAREATIVARLRERYEEQGYQFFARPPADLLPSAIRAFSPPAVAIRGDEGVVIGIVGQPDGAASPRLEELARRLAGVPGWTLMLYSTRDFREPVIDAPTSEQFAAQVAEVDALAHAGRSRAAFLLAWTTLEAAARRLLPENRTRRPLAPEQVLEGLTMFGAIEQGAADRLRALADLRDRIGHGDPNAVVTDDILQMLIDQLHELRDLIGIYPSGDSPSGRAVP